MIPLDKIQDLMGRAEKAAPDCGDNSCYFVKDKRGMRTNGGCRCGLREIRDISFRHFIMTAKPDFILSLCKSYLELVEARDEAREIVEHSLAMEHFAPGGSMAGWAKDWLAKHGGKGKT